MEKEIKIHPVYTDYGADSDGNVYSFKKNKIRVLKLIKDEYGYHIISVYHLSKVKNIKVHKLIYECFNGLVNLSTKNGGEGLTIDHIDGNKLNNSINNLQLLSTRLNTQKSRNKTSIYTGVTFDSKWNSYYTRIVFERKTKHIGTFKNELDAAKAFDDKYYEIHGLRPNNT